MWKAVSWFVLNVSTGTVVKEVIFDCLFFVVNKNATCERQMCAIDEVNAALLASFSFFQQNRSDKKDMLI
jgi:hypothetical protein